MMLASSAFTEVIDIVVNDIVVDDIVVDDIVVNDIMVKDNVVNDASLQCLHGSQQHCGQHHV